MPKKLLIKIIATVLVAVMGFLVGWLQPFYLLDKPVSDALYQTGSTPDKRIKIITIDEKTMAKYGNPDSWSRGLFAELLDKLNHTGYPQPLLVAFDIMFIADNDPISDQAFAEACEESGNVVVAANLIFRDQFEQLEDGSYAMAYDRVSQVEYPFSALKNASKYGFANTLLDSKDNYVRCALTYADFQGEKIDSFDVALYRLYCEKKGIPFELPKTEPNGSFGFAYSGKSFSYETISMVDLLDGTVDARACSGCILFVGAYASGLQDAYQVAIQRGAQMYGVEIHANIFQAIMEGKTSLSVNQIVYALIVALVVAVFFWFSDKLKPLYTTIVLVVLVGINVLVCKLLFVTGHVADLLPLPLLLIVVFAYQLLSGFIIERKRRHEVVSAFKQYVAPQVVEEIAKSGDFHITLGGENRHIAVLFVDIRGFTPMSESLQPEQVVSILNEYLSLTTKSIFKNGGTLDKFIGDATMALFNAPVDLEDYIYKAVCTARDIRDGASDLHQKLMERFGKSVNFGIGVNCGEAVIGNIGCDFRMDYTAIGDTVNTAARLESNAKSGQILISDAVYQAVKDRVKVTEVGVIPLKGKSNGVFVYQVDEVL